MNNQTVNFTKVNQKELDEDMAYENVIQHNKNEAMKKDEEKFQEYIENVRKTRIEFFDSILLDKSIKERLFGVKLETNHKPPPLFIVQHPFQGNLLVTEEGRAQLREISKKEHQERKEIHAKLARGNKS